MSLSILFLAITFQESLAASLGGTDSVISPPVGQDLLPGGNMSADDFKSSILFVKLIPFLIRYGIGLAVGLSVVALMIGGYQYFLAYGVAEKDEKARKTILYAIIGLVLSLTAYGIVSIVTRLQLS